MSDDYEHLVKILMVGESGVGKTCLIKRFIKNEFSLTHLSTIAIDFKMKVLKVQNTMLKLQIWDTAGQERFNTLTAGFFKGSDGVVVTYSVTERKSYDNVNKWMNQIHSLAPKNVRIVLVGNKIDMQEQREVTVEEGKAMAQKYDAVFFETSAKSGENVEQVFNKLAEDILFKIKENPKSNDETSLTSMSKLKSDKKKCCK
jgi:small GTP-binding protein